MTIEDPSGHKIIDGQETGITVRRVTVHGRAQNFSDVGWPALVDDLGCVWLAHPAGNSVTTVTVWVPSGKTTTVTIPRRAPGGPLVAAGKGRVFAVTREGLQELVADKTPQPDTYSLGRLYALDECDERRARSLQYSSLGYLVAAGDKHGDGTIRSVVRLFNLDGLPGGADAGHAAGTAGPKPKSDAPLAGDLRTWHDASGRHSLKATFVSSRSANRKAPQSRRLDGQRTD